MWQRKRLLATEASARVATEKTPPDKTVSAILTQRDFYQIARKAKTDKVTGPERMQECLKDPKQCPRAEAVNPKCRIVGHFYHDIYQRWLGPYSTDGIEPFQFLEIGFGQGHSVPAFEEFLPRAERHVMDIACTEDRMKNAPPYMKARYQKLLDVNRLHCGDSSNFEFLHKIYSSQLRRPDAPPLRVVIEDASHIPQHMAVALFFGLPRIELGGLLIMEDIEPNVSNKHGGHGIQTDLLPQIVNDIHYCGDAIKTEDPACFPTIQPLIKSVHCDLHICVFERSQVPASDPPKEVSMPPPNALDAKRCLLK